MQDDNLETVASQESLSVNSGAELSDCLRTGVWAALAAGALAAASVVAELVEGPIGGITLAHTLAWAALVPLFYVLRAYQALARQTQSRSLKTSSACLFGVIVLLQVIDLATLDSLPVWMRSATWVVFGIGLLALLAVPFTGTAEEAEAVAQTPMPATADETAVTKGGWAGLIGGVVVVLVVLFKLAAKGWFVKLLIARRLWKWLGENGADLEAAAGCLLLLFGVAALLWFAVSKIRLRDRLGGVAALLGGVEVLMVVAFAGLMTWFIAATVDGQEPETLLEQASQAAMLIGIAAALVWSSLTAWLFAAARN